MSSDLLTIAVGVAGVLASVLCSAAAFRWGAQQADRQKTELLLRIHELQSMLSGLVRGIESGATATGGPTVPWPSSSYRGSHISSEAECSPATELLVRASLGALLDERGEVRLQRLLDEVASALGSPSQAGTIFALQRLRETGVVDWDGAADLSDVQVVRVRPPGEHRRQSPTTTAGALIV